MGCGASKSQGLLDELGGKSTSRTPEGNEIAHKGTVLNKHGGVTTQGRDTEDTACHGDEVCPEERVKGCRLGHEKMKSSSFASSSKLEANGGMHYQENAPLGSTSIKVGSSTVGLVSQGKVNADNTSGKLSGKGFSPGPKQNGATAAVDDKSVKKKGKSSTRVAEAGMASPTRDTISQGDGPTGTKNNRKRSDDIKEQRKAMREEVRSLGREQQVVQREERYREKKQSVEEEKVPVDDESAKKKGMSSVVDMASPTRDSTSQGDDLTVTNKNRKRSDDIREKRKAIKEEEKSLGREQQVVQREERRQRHLDRCQQKQRAEEKRCDAIKRVNGATQTE